MIKIYDVDKDIGWSGCWLIGVDTLEERDKVLQELRWGRSYCALFCGNPPREVGWTMPICCVKVQDHHTEFLRGGQAILIEPSFPLIGDRAVPSQSEIHQRFGTYASWLEEEDGNSA